MLVVYQAPSEPCVQVDRDSLSLLPPRVLTRPWKRVFTPSFAALGRAILPGFIQPVRLVREWHLVSGAVLHSLQCEGVCEGERKLAVLVQSMLFIPAFSALFPSASPSECLMCREGEVEGKWCCAMCNCSLWQQDLATSRHLCALELFFPI